MMARLGQVRHGGLRGSAGGGFVTRFLAVLLTVGVLLGFAGLRSAWSAPAAIVDPSVISLTQDTDSFYVDTAAPANIHTMNLNANNIVAGDVIIVDLGVFTLNQPPIVSQATVKLSGSTLTLTFNQDINGAVGIPLDLRNTTFTNTAKDLSDIQAAIDSGAVPGPQSVTADLTKKADGTVYEATLSVDAKLSPYSTPAGFRQYVFDLSGVRNVEKSHSASGIQLNGYATDGKNHPGGVISDMTIDMPSEAGFVLDTAKSPGWTLSGTTLTYHYDPDISGASTTLYGTFTGVVGKYTIPVGSVTMTQYYGYDTTPVVLTNSEVFTVTITSPATYPALDYPTQSNQYVYNIDDATGSSDRVPADTDASMTNLFYTRDICNEVSGDNPIMNANWNIRPQSPSSPVLVKSFTVPVEAESLTVTFQDGTTEVFELGQTATFTDTGNLITAIDIDFGQLPVNATITFPMDFVFLNTSKSLGSQAMIQVITGTMKDGTLLREGATAKSVAPHRYSPSLTVYTGPVSTVVQSAGRALVTSSTMLQYGGGAESVRVSSVGVKGNATYYGSGAIYEPVVYIALPLGVDYQDVTGGLPGYKVTTYTISTGQTVVKIDYTDTGQLVGNGSSDYPSVNYVTKPYGVARTSSFYAYFSTKNDPAMTVSHGSLQGMAPSASLTDEITQGDGAAVLGVSGNVSINGTVYLLGATSVTNNVGMTSKAGVNDYIIGVDHTLNVDMLNTTKGDGGAVSALTNLPDASDGLTLRLTGPATLMNMVTSTPVMDTSLGQVLYSTSEQMISDDQPIDETGYVPASQVSDWSKVKSFIVEISQLNANTEYSAAFPVTAPDAIHQLNKVVTISTAVRGEGLDSATASTDEFITSVPTAHATVKYSANGGDVSSVPASQESDIFLSNTTGGVTLTESIPTWTSADFVYTFEGWNTAANGTGTDYQPGDIVSGLSPNSTTTLYAQWTVWYAIPKLTGPDIASVLAGESFNATAGVTVSDSSNLGDHKAVTTVTGPDGSAVSFSADGTVSNVMPGVYTVTSTYSYDPPDLMPQTVMFTRTVKVTPRVPTIDDPGLPVSIVAGDSLDLSTIVNDPDHLGDGKAVISVVEVTDAGEVPVTISSSGVLSTGAKDFGHYKITYTYPYAVDGVDHAPVTLTKNLTVKIVMPNLDIDPIPSTVVGTPFDPDSDTLVDLSDVVVDGPAGVIESVYPPGTTFDTDGNPVGGVAPVAPNADGTVTPTAAGDYVVVFRYTYVDEEGAEHSQTSVPITVHVNALGYTIPSLSYSDPGDLSVYASVNVSDLVMSADGRYADTAQTPLPIDDGSLSITVLDPIGNPVTIEEDGTFTPTMSGVYKVLASATFTPNSILVGAPTTQGSLSVAGSFVVSSVVPAISTPIFIPVMEGNNTIDVSTVMIADGNNSAGDDEDNGLLSIAVTGPDGSPVVITDGVVSGLDGGIYTVTYTYTYQMRDSNNELVTKTVQAVTDLVVKQIPDLIAPNIAGVAAGESFDTSGVSLVDADGLGGGSGMVVTSVVDPSGKSVAVLVDGTALAQVAGIYTVTYSYDYVDTFGVTQTISVITRVSVGAAPATGSPAPRNPGADLAATGVSATVPAIAVLVFMVGGVLLMRSRKPSRNQ